MRDQVFTAAPNVPWPACGGAPVASAGKLPDARPLRVNNIMSREPQLVLSPPSEHTAIPHHHHSALLTPRRQYANSAAAAGASQPPPPVSGDHGTTRGALGRLARICEAQSRSDAAREATGGLYTPSTPRHAPLRGRPLPSSEAVPLPGYP